LVAIRQVQVTGLSGPDVAQIRRALTASAETMTTLNLDVSALERAVQDYPYVRSLRVSTHLLHGVTIDVLEDVPVALVSTRGRTVTVNGAGRVLPNDGAPHGLLPSVPLGTSSSIAAGASRLTAAGPLSALTVLAAAPYGFLSHVASAVASSAHGVVVQLRNGPQIYFGQGGQLVAKWTAALAVLAGAGSAGAQYIDVSDPERPAVGARVPASQQGSSSTTTTSSTTG
jgi:cell division protein FtsQ